MVCRYVEIRCQVSVSGIHGFEKRSKSKQHGSWIESKCTHMNHNLTLPSLSYIIERITSTGRALNHCARLGSPEPPWSWCAHHAGSSTDNTIDWLINRSMDRPIDESALFSSWAAPVSSRCVHRHHVFLCYLIIFALLHYQNLSRAISSMPHSPGGWAFLLAP